MSSPATNNWSVWRSVVLGLISLLVLVAGFGSWAVTSTIAGAIVAQGRIEVERNRQVVQHETGGVVEKIEVKEGDSVEAGDLLIQLDPQNLGSQLAIVEDQLFELMARRARLEAERDGKDVLTFDPTLLEVEANDPDVKEVMTGQVTLFEARGETIAQQIEQLAKRRRQIADGIDGMAAQETAMERQLELIEEELSNQQSLLDRGLAQASTVLTLQREQARLGGQIGELTAGRAQSEGRMTEIDLQVLSLATARREEAVTQLRDLRSRELELRERREALLVSLDRLAITAPVSGIVYALKVQTPRSVVRAAEPLLYLVPQDRPLIIAARVQPIHVDQISVGQQVNLRLSSLDQRSTPELRGQVMQISADAIEDTATGRTFYRAEIALNAGEIDRLPSGTVLLPGMPVEAFIRTGDRSPLAYLVKPLTDYFVRAFRES